MHKRTKVHLVEDAPVEETQELLLDDIYNSSDPAVKRALHRTMQEEMSAAQERALLRVAAQFRHLLSPHMQRVLAGRLTGFHQAVVA